MASPKWPADFAFTQEALKIGFSSILPGAALIVPSFFFSFSSAG
jgi:hypothetical protein